MKKNTKITYNLIILAIFIPAFLLVLFLTGIFPIANTAGNILQQQLYKIVASGTIVQATFTISAICIFALSIIIRIATLKGSYKGVYLKDAKDVIEPIYAERIIDSITNPTNLILAEIVDLIKRGFLAINELGNIDILNSNATSFDDTADYYFVNSILKIPGMKRFQNKGITSVTLNNVITGVALNPEDAKEFHEFDDYIEGKIYEKKLIKMIPTYIVYAIRIITFALAMGSICLFMVNFTGKIGFLAALIFIIISAFGLSETLEVQKKMIMFGYDLHKYKTVSRRMNIITALLLIVLFIAAFLTFAFYKTNGLFFGISFFLNVASWLILKDVKVYTELGKKVYMNARILFNYLKDNDWNENKKLSVDSKYDYISYALAYGFSIDEVLEKSKKFKDEEIIKLRKYLEEVNKY